MALKSISLDSEIAFAGSPKSKRQAQASKKTKEKIIFPLGSNTPLRPVPNKSTFASEK